MSDKTYGSGGVPFSQLSPEAKKAAREQWQQANQSQKKTDAEIDQMLAQGSQKFTKEGDPA